MKRALITFVSLVSFVSLSAAARVSAQPADLIGIRAQGMGGAFTAVADDATAPWWNPAGMAGGALFSGIVEYGHPEKPAGTEVKGVSMTFPALGLSYYRLPVSQMRLPATTEQLAAGREDQGTLSEFGATVGQSIGNHLVLASTMKLLRANDTHVDLDLGAMVMFGRMRGGITLRNATKPSFSNGAVNGADVLTLERQVRAGVALTTGTRGVIGTATVAADADLRTVTTIAGDERRVAAGAEIWTTNKVLGVRGGVNANTVGERNAALSGGVSAAVRKGTYVDLQTTGGSEKARHGWGLALRVTF
jgi:hypothetical protein